jgi:hypothetical protein
MITDPLVLNSEDLVPNEGTPSTDLDVPLSRFQLNGTASSWKISALANLPAGQPGALFRDGGFIWRMSHQLSGKGARMRQRTLRQATASFDDGNGVLVPVTMNIVIDVPVVRPEGSDLFTGVAQMLNYLPSMVTVELNGAALDGQI